MTAPAPSSPSVAQAVPVHKLGASPRHLLGILSTWIFALLPANLVPPIIGALVDELGVSLTLAGVAATSMTVANAVGVLSMRGIVSRGHRTLVARIGVGILLLAFGAAAIVPTAVVVMAALVVGGLGSGMVIAAATSAVAGVQDPDRATTTVITVNRLILALSFLLLPYLGGGIQAIMFLLLGVGVIAFLGTAWLTSTSGEPIVVDGHETVPDVTEVPGSRALAWALAIGFAVWTVSEEGVYGVMSILMANNLPLLDEAGVYRLLAAGVIGGLVGALASPLVHRVFGRTGGLALVFAVSIAAKLTMMVVQNDVAYLVASVGWGLMFGCSIPLVFGMAAKLSRSGSANVLVNGIYIIGVAIGPLVATQVLDLGGIPGLAVVMTVIGVLAATAIVVTAHRARPVIAQVRSEVHQ